MTMMIGDPPMFGGMQVGCPRCGGWNCFGGCHQNQQIPDHLYRQFTQPYTPLPMIPEIDYERLADLIAERLQRPKGYQG